MFGQKNEEKELARIKKSAREAKKLGLKVNAGHDLTYQNVTKIAVIKEMEELSIGHNIIARAVLAGLDRAVKEMIELIKS